MGELSYFGTPCFLLTSTSLVKKCLEILKTESTLASHTKHRDSRGSRLIRRSSASTYPTPITIARVHLQLHDVASGACWGCFDDKAIVSHHHAAKASLRPTQPVAAPSPSFRFLPSTRHTHSPHSLLSHTPTFHHVQEVFLRISILS